MSNGAEAFDSFPESCWSLDEFNAKQAAQAGSDESADPDYLFDIREQTLLTGIDDSGSESLAHEDTDNVPAEMMDAIEQIGRKITKSMVFAVPHIESEYRPRNWHKKSWVKPGNTTLNF